MSKPTIPDELDEIIVNLYLGEDYTQQYPNWKAQMQNPVLKEAKQELTKLISKREIEARIDETKRWMPISPDPHNAWDMKFVEAGKLRLNQLTELQEGKKQ